MIRACSTRWSKPMSFLCGPEIWSSRHCQISSSMPAALRHWKAMADSPRFDEDELFEDIGYETEDETRPGPLVSEIVRRVGRIADLDELERNDSKFEKFSGIVRRFLEG